MPVSPRDFLLYSRMTGKPMPENAMERMRMAPEVYQFTKDFARKPNLLEKTGNLVKGIGKNIGAGIALAAASPAFVEDKEMTDVTGEVQPEIPAALQVEQEKTRRAKMEIEGRENVARIANAGVQKGNLNEVSDDEALGVAKSIFGSKTTADNYEQDVIPQQTVQEQGQRSATQQAELETNQTIADNAAASQDFKPMFRPTQIPTIGALDAATPVVGEGLSESGNEINIIKGEQEEMVGGLANVTEAVDKFVDKHGGMSEQSKLDPILLAAIQDRNKKERFYLGANSGDPALANPPLSDNPQTPPGQTNSAVSQPFAENIEPIINPSPNLTPQMQSILNTLAKSRADLSQDQRMNIARKMVSPNELAGKDQATFEALTGSPSQQQLVEASQARSRVEQKTAAKQRKSGIQSRMTDKYYPSDVARTDIQVGGMRDKKTGLGKSVGISYTPLNGDTKVGFNIMSDPTKPQDVSTFDFVASPKTMESLESQQEGDLGALAFGKLFNIAKQKKQGFSGMEM